MDQDLRSRIKAAAEERGVDPEIAVSFAKAESSLNPNAKAKTSSASGLFQVINKTWKEYGGRDKRDIDEQIRVGTDVIASNQASFKRKFNREPSAAELYAYHVLGPTGAPQLLRADPNTPMEKVVSPEALKANSVWKGKTAGQVLGMYEKKVGSQKAPVVADRTKPGMRPTNYSFEPLTQLDIDQMGPNYKAALAAVTLADTSDDDDDGEGTERTMERMAENDSMVEEEAPMSTAAIRDIGMGQTQPVLMADGGEARKMLEDFTQRDLEKILSNTEVSGYADQSKQGKNIVDVKTGRLGYRQPIGENETLSGGVSGSAIDWKGEDQQGRKYSGGKSGVTGADLAYQDEKNRLGIRYALPQREANLAFQGAEYSRQLGDDNGRIGARYTKISPEGIRRDPLTEVYWTKEFNEGGPVYRADGSPEEGERSSNFVDDALKKVTNMVVGAGIKGYGAIADRSSMPSNKRIYLESFADEQRTPITEKNFTADELKTIGEIIKTKHSVNPKATKGSIKYEDYNKFISPLDTSIVAGVSSGERNPYENIRTTLGQFNYKVDPKTGNAVISDVYDFNKLDSNAMTRGDYAVNTLSPYSIARVYGEETMPVGKGRPVTVQIPGLLGNPAPVRRAEGSPEYGEISMGDFSGTVKTGDARKELSNFFKQGWKMPTKEDAKVLARIPVEALSNLESVGRASVAAEIGGYGDFEAGFRGPRADSQAFPTKDDPTAFFSGSGTTGKVNTTIPQTQEILDAMPKRLTPTNERTEGFEEIGKWIALGPAGWALSKAPAAYRATKPVVGGAVAKGAEKVKSILKPSERVAPPVTNIPDVVQAAPINLRGNAVADVAATPSPVFQENFGVSRYLMPKDFVGGKAVALDAPYPHFVSKLDQFTAALPGAVTKGQYLGSLKGKFRDYEILRAEEALAGLDANAKLKPADIAEKLKNVTPVDRLKTYIDEPSNSMPHRDYDNPHNDKPVGIVNLMTDIPEAQRATADEALTVRHIIQKISVGDAPDKFFDTVMPLVNNSDMAPDLKARTLSALEDAKVMTDGLRQDTAKINGLLDDLIIPFQRKQDEYEKLIASLRKKEKLSQYDAMDKATKMMRTDAAKVLRKEGYPVPSNIEQMGLISTDSEEWKALQKAQDRIRDRFSLDQSAKKVDIANRFHDSNKGDSLYNQIENHLTRKFMYEGQHPSLSKQGEVPVGISRFVDNVVDIPGRGKTEIMHVIDLQSDLYDDLLKHGGKHTSPEKDLAETSQLRSELRGLLEKASGKLDESRRFSSEAISDYMNNAFQEAAIKYKKEGKSINANAPSISLIKTQFKLGDKELMDVLKAVQRRTLLSSRILKSEGTNVSEHSYNIDQVFPGMEKSPQVVQQMLVKNAVMGALRRGKQGITFPGAESDQAQLYEKLPNNLRQVIKDLGPGFELVPNIVQDTAKKGQISNWGIVWDPETAQNVLKAGVRFNKGGLVEKNHDDNRRFL